jgi:malonate-semialdehyde dehydrogenase (acetylating)/methylmalonate-semialdehyde dehydrogenase
MSVTESPVVLIPEYKAHYGLVPNYIDGCFVPSESSRILAIDNPATGKEIATVAMSTAAEVDAAAQAAHAAYHEWRRVPPQVRVQYLFKMKHAMEEHLEDLARVVTQEHGKSLEEARGSVARGIEHLEVACGMPSLMMGYNLEDGAAPGIDEEMIRQPMGVFSCIAPFNFPMMVPFWFWPYAVAAGNTYIVKPSEQDPISQMLIFELLHEIGLPAGVMNMVNGDKEVVDAMLHHPLIRGISFVGSTRVGHYVYHEGAKFKKRVQAQAGAKNHLVVMPDAVLDKASQNWINSFFGCAGERCLAGSVLVCVGEETHRAAALAFKAEAEKVSVGYGLDERVAVGPVISKSAKERILGLIETGIAEGATLLLDGRNPDVVTPGCEDGYFVGPTIFDNVTPEMTIAQEEIFGPVACIMKVDTLDEALKIIDESPYGNAASIYTQDGFTARKFKYEANAGNIGINIGVPAAMAYFPFAGRKDSFFGDLHGQGRDAIDFFTDKKVVVNRWIWDPKTMGTWS